MEEKELVQSAQKEDKDSFGILVERYRNKMFYLAYSMTNNRETADDLAQEVFIKAYRALPRFNLESKFSTWLYRIAINTIKDFHRKESGIEKVSLDQRTDVPDAKNFKGEEEKQEKLKLIRENINKLPEKHRIILTLRDVQGKSYSEIADILKIAPGTVDSRLFRARKKLRKVMAPYLSLFRRES
ncbi:MAG: sigma-70 family RNA polymerase sigma factor [Candidatus Aminicenantes bacterium]